MQARIFMNDEQPIESLVLASLASSGTFVLGTYLIRMLISRARSMNDRQPRFSVKLGNQHYLLLSLQCLHTHF